MFLNAIASDILANQGRPAFVRYCEGQRDAADQGGYAGAAEYWQAQLDAVPEQFNLF